MDTSTSTWIPTPCCAEGVWILNEVAQLSNPLPVWNLTVYLPKAEMCDSIWSKFPERNLCAFLFFCTTQNFLKMRNFKQNFLKNQISAKGVYGFNQNLASSLQMLLHTGGGGGYSNYFWRGCATRGLKPLLILTFFAEIFANWDPFLRVFLPQNGRFYSFCRNFREMGPLSKDFFEQNETHV